VNSPLAQLLGMTQGQPETPPARPHMAAQYMELSARYDALQVRHDIRTGMFVREKPGVGIIKPEISVALMVIRFVSLDDPFDNLLVRDWIEGSGLPITGHGADCVVGWLDSDCKALLMRLASRTTLEPVPVEETAALIADTLP
jgi:hypothetical protein